MATATTATHATAATPIPIHYFCKSCGLEAHHWIMNCSVLRSFHTANHHHLLRQQSGHVHVTDASSPSISTSLHIECSVEHSITECQSFHRIIMALSFYQTHSQNDEQLRLYFARYPHLVNDYTHILSAHLSKEKEMNDMQMALVYTKLASVVQCDLAKCPFYVRTQRMHSPYHGPITSSSSSSCDTDLIFLKHTLNTIHCFFLHPFHTGFKMVKSLSYSSSHGEHDQSAQSTTPTPTWQDTELGHLQNELHERRAVLHSMGGIQSNQYNKFMIDIGDADVGQTIDDDDDDKDKDDDEKTNPKSTSSTANPMHQYFGERYYFWPWYKNNSKEDWRCNPGRLYRDLYIAPKFADLKQEILCHEQPITLSAIEFQMVYVKATKLMRDAHSIRRMRSEGNQFCHYDIDDGQPLFVEHLMAVILHTDYQQISEPFRASFRRRSNSNSNSESESAFKRRQSMYHFWARHLREAVELYGTSVQDSKMRRFYVTLSSAVIFASLSARFCAPTSTTTSLQIVSMCTNNGLILELSPTAEMTNFYQGGLKYFNCELVSAFAEEHECLFIGGWAPLQFNNIRALIERKENYAAFIKAIQHFNAILDGEENEEYDEFDAMRGGLGLPSTSHMSRRTSTMNSNVSSQSEYSQCSQLSQIDDDGVDCKSPSQLRAKMNAANLRQLQHLQVPQLQKKKPRSRRRGADRAVTRARHHVQKESSMDSDKIERIDSDIVAKLCETLLDHKQGNGYPDYVNGMFHAMCLHRDHIFINLYVLKTQFNCFSSILVTPEFDALVRFYFLAQLFRNCKTIVVDMKGSQTQKTNFWLSFCKQMIEIEKHIKIKHRRLKLTKIVLLKINRQYLTVDVWNKIHKKYGVYSAQIWYQSLFALRYALQDDFNLTVFFDKHQYHKSCTQRRKASEDEFVRFRTQTDVSVALDNPNSIRL